jgi:hypothetical protein
MIDAENSLLVYILGSSVTVSIQFSGLATSIPVPTSVELEQAIPHRAKRAAWEDP